MVEGVVGVDGGTVVVVVGGAGAGVSAGGTGSGVLAGGAVVVVVVGGAVVVVVVVPPPFRPGSAFMNTTVTHRRPSADVLAPMPT